MIVVPSARFVVPPIGGTRDAELHMRARLEDKPLGYFRDDLFLDSTFEASIL